MIGMTSSFRIKVRSILITTQSTSLSEISLLLIYPHVDLDIQTMAAMTTDGLLISRSDAEKGGRSEVQ